jgi:hypothetical protein
VDGVLQSSASSIHRVNAGQQRKAMYYLQVVQCQFRIYPMKIPSKYSNLLFGCLLSLIMVTVISGTVILANQGLTPDFPQLWLKGFATAWPIAFPTVLVVAPRVRKIVERLTEPAT